MDAALAASALLMGLTGSLHCMAMCGAAFAAIAGHGARSAMTHAMVSLHAGRLVSYAAAGALVAASVSSLDSLQAAGPLLRPLWALVHVGAVVLGLCLVWKARAPAWLTLASPRPDGLANTQVVRFLGRMPASGRSGLLGVCWAGIPCGLLQSALLVAALASGPVQGAAVMTSFAGASALGLWAGPRLWASLRAGGERWASFSARLAGALLVASSLFALSHGLGATMEQVLCRVPI